MTETNEVLNAILDQVYWRELRMAKFRFVKMDEETLRINKGKKNFDIRYDVGSDTYEVLEHKMNARTFEVKTEKYKDVYWEDLANRIEQFFNFHYALKGAKLVIGGV